MCKMRKRQCMPKLENVEIVWVEMNEDRSGFGPRLCVVAKSDRVLDREVRDGSIEAGEISSPQMCGRA